MIGNLLREHRNWEGSLEDLTRLASRLTRDRHAWGGRRLRPPTRALVVDYRHVGLIAPAVGKRYLWQHLVQLVAGCALVQQGQSRKDAAKLLQSMPPEEVVQLLEHGGPLPSLEGIPSGYLDVADQARALVLAHEAVTMLAAGLVDHFKRAKTGQALIHGASLSVWLRGALSRLASLQVMHGLPVQHDGAHDLVAQARHPISARAWGIPAFDWPTFHYSGIRLLDPAVRLPTLDCIDIARHVSSELDMQEQQAFAQLNTMCDQFGSRGDEVYSLVREFIVRHPIVATNDLKTFQDTHNLQLAAPFMASCYEGVQPHHLVANALHCCASCGMPLVASTVEGHVSCRARQCKAFDAPVLLAATHRSHGKETLVARPHILVYWCGPGQDELALYDTAVAASLCAALYPARDACDLSTDGDVVGIDVKSHASPFFLADTLNRSLGRLELFAKKYVAVNDQAISRYPGYLETVRREVARHDVEITSVAALKQQLKARP